jgi:hypothetical protein
MALAPDVIEEAPRLLLATGAAAVFLAAILGLAMLRRMARGVVGRNEKPWGIVRWLLTLIVSLALAGYGASALMVAAALTGYRAFSDKTRVAEVQCIELEPGKLRLYYVELDPAGKRGATRTFDLNGDEWTVGGEVLRWRPFLTALGAKPYAGITRVEGRWSKAADANAHKPTAFDLHADTIGTWRWLQHNGERGPLKWAIDGVHGSAVSQQADRLAVYDVSITPDGYVLSKR